MAKASATIDLKSLKEASKHAINYMDFDSTNGLRISQAKDYSKPYVQIINNGIKILYNSTYFTNLTSTGMSVYAGNSSNPIAHFGSSIQLGANNSQRVEIGSTNGMNVFDFDDSRTTNKSIVRLNASATGVSIFDYDDDAPNNRVNVAQFTKTARIGAANSSHISINSDSMTMTTGQYEEVLNFGRATNSTQYERSIVSGLIVLSGTKNVNIPQMPNGTTIRVNIVTYTDEWTGGSTVIYEFSYGTASTLSNIIYNGSNLLTLPAQGSNTLYNISFPVEGAPPTWSFGARNVSQTSGAFSWVAGDNNAATNKYSFAFGRNNMSKGEQSFTLGRNLIANGNQQLVTGAWNIADNTSLFIIGNGNGSARSNALKVANNGSIYAGSAATSGERQISVQSPAGKIYLYAQSANNGAVGIWSYNAAGDPKAILSVNQAQTITITAPFISGTASTNGHFDLKYSITDIKTNRNGLPQSTTSTPTTEMRHISCRDINNEYLGGFEFKSSEENTIGWRALVHNWNSGASTPAWTGYKGIICDVARDGTTTWQVFPADGFRTAINAAPAAPTAQVTVANNDMIIIADASDSNKMTGGPKFDGSTATACLSKKGTWENFVPSSNVSTSGEYSKIPQITASGVLEGGRHLDFHYASAALDYAVRMSCGDPSGTNGDGSLTITANGGVTMSGALKVNNHSSAIGTVKDAYLSAAKKVPTGTSTGTPLCSISLEAGTWLITAGVRAPANNTGVRVANVSTTSGDASLVVNQQAVQGANTQMRFVIATVATATTTYYLNAMQNSGSELNYPAGGAGWGNFLRAVRIA